MAKLVSLIAGIQRKVRGDKRLSGLLLSLASGQVSGEDIFEFSRLVTQIYYLSETTGYSWNAGAAGYRTTREGLYQAALNAKAKGGLLAERVGERLSESPDLLSLIKEATLSHSAVYEGVTEGQGITAEEFGLKYKTWIRTGSAEEERPHSILEGTTIRADELFQLPSGAQCTGPHDWSAGGAEEWRWCQHQIIYTDAP